ncbi:metal-binding protein [Rhodothalassium salexigens]|uniref:Putative metal-binding protein n=1 Tax=Rhodothalassium salexigens DSM 2132 TaxID=1188247 RepID=A0A4R2PGQ1_RHOSA|nr:DUF1636 domain-containing protein [Rhodothalassium salexigens]MBB4211509.1 putative metal-binding protein [Rhodothalassium salexigens DSM 2132]MBK1639746.1 metal-binding protein [Rhodothalassium salexigens DSM 2132]MBK5912323.1 metal-binding protein [Rhodothalassium salexigens]MBK5920388.1 metal-binding protein [Rhodothalassium salexigens]TCP34559.1 putative metal-binding protein [Rhodothalassium salexigens DSM 2132]
MVTLKPAAEAAVVVCRTCKYAADNREGPDGRTGGAHLAEALRQGRDRAGDDALAIEETDCLFACSRFCTVHLRAPGKVSYVLGGFEPTPAAADAILTFFRHYLDSDGGAVPFKLWPQGVKGRFITRQPPPGAVVER